MDVWLITIGEPLPIDQGSPRLLRAGLLAKYLAQLGHEVTWWSSTFDHHDKRLRASASRETMLADRTRLVLLHGRPYSANVSLARIRNHREISRQFAVMALARPIPDIILCSYPTVELCVEAVKYGQARQVPVVLDIRDLWPDAFLDLVPPWIRRPARSVLQPLFAESAFACRGATALFGLTDKFRDWGVERAGRAPTRLDATFPMAYPQEMPDGDAIHTAETEWNRRGVLGNRSLACYFGTFGPYIDFEVVIRAARICRDREPNLLWVLCGDGPRFMHTRNMAKGLDTVIFPGWVSRAEIYTLMRRAKVGLVPYRSSDNYLWNLPNKPIEYLSAGLPVVATIEGVFHDKVVGAGAGISVPAGDSAALARAVIGLISDTERHSRMSRAAIDLYKKEYVAEVVYRNMITHLEKISRQNKASKKFPAHREGVETTSVASPAETSDPARAM